ncbi:MAG: competence protein ComA [Peptococcaceae bacterium BICA1-7]|nr:MAG: competence protein ComA [Peptococcaceae bacterium BICA1-7]HBV98829.1 competence protein ComA [Desulfotomaculum sp.]
MNCWQGSQIIEEEVGRLLEERGLSLGLAESCTGGMIAARITDVPGSSAYFAGGVVAYDNSIKEVVLGVPAGELNQYGAVSGQVARSMAEGARKLMKTDFGLAVTGVAGPGGGTPGKPVGLVYIALTGPRGTTARELRLAGSRAQIRTATVQEALTMLLLELLNNRE